MKYFPLLIFISFNLFAVTRKNCPATINVKLDDFVTYSQDYESLEFEVKEQVKDEMEYFSNKKSFEFNLSRLPDSDYGVCFYEDKINKTKAKLYTRYRKDWLRVDHLGEKFNAIKIRFNVTSYGPNRGIEVLNRPYYNFYADYEYPYYGEISVLQFSLGRTENYSIN